MDAGYAIDDCELWDAYRHNLPRHLIGIARYLQAETMYSLAERGHTGLRLGFSPFIDLVEGPGRRISDIAQWLGISKQACSQTVGEIERAGYLRRVPDTGDGRVRWLVLTEQGRRLVIDGAQTAAMIECQLGEFLGKRLAELAGLLEALYRGLQLPGNGRVSAGRRPTLISAMLPRISDHVMHRLMTLTAAKGHRGLKISHAQVLTLTGPQGITVQQIARVQQISKQAVSAIARDLTELGYLERARDPADNRQTILRLSPQGKALLTASVLSVAELDAEFQAILGAPGLRQLRSLTAELFSQLCPEAGIPEPQPGSGRRLYQFADLLRQQLGGDRARELAMLLGQPVHWR